MRGVSVGGFRSYNTSLFSAVRFDESLFTCQCEKESRRKGHKGTNFAFLLVFSSGIVAVKGLIVSEWFVGVQQYTTCLW